MSEVVKRYFNYGIILVAVFVLAGCNLIYTNVVNSNSEERVRHDREVSEQKFCNLINLVVSVYETNPPPTTQLGIELRDTYYQLHDDLGCEKKG